MWQQPLPFFLSPPSCCCRSHPVGDRDVIARNVSLFPCAPGARPMRLSHSGSLQASSLLLSFTPALCFLSPSPMLQLAPWPSCVKQPASTRPLLTQPQLWDATETPLGRGMQSRPGRKVTLRGLQSDVMPPEGVVGACGRPRGHISVEANRGADPSGRT